MRILLVNNHSTVTGGADVQCFRLAALLRQRGHEVRLLATRSDDPDETSGTFVPLAVTHENRTQQGPRQQVRIAARAFWNRTAAQAAERLTESFQPDVVHLHKLYPQLSVAPVVIAAKARIPIVQTAHDYEFIAANHSDPTSRHLDRQETDVRFRALNSALFVVKRYSHVPRVSRWVTVSDAVAERYERHGIIAEVLPNFTEATTRRIPAFGERSGAIFVGRLSAEKGVRDALRIAERTGLPLLVAGQGPMQREVEDAATRIPNVTYAGQQSRERLALMFRSARVALMPAAWEEPGPLAALEALEAGTPIAAYDVGGLGEYVRAGGAGMVAPAGDSCALQSCVETLNSDDRLWETASASARNAALDRHSPERYLDALQDLYESEVRRA
ncbi:glycosyltransferase family 4 protein [Patulibacter sp. S7RM1-6]